MKIKLIVLLVLAAITVGCGMQTVKSDGFSGLNNTSVYIAPPRDLTHGGALVEGSGTLFLHYLKQHLHETSGGKLRVLIVDVPTLGNRNIDIAEVFQKAQQTGTDYLLTIVLGDMRDAAPMSFRSDYVSIAEGVLYRVSDKKEVWRAFPYRIEGGNIGQYNRLLDALAREVATSLIRETTEGDR